MRWFRIWRKPLAALLPPTETMPLSLPGTSVPSLDVEKVRRPLSDEPRHVAVGRVTERIEVFAA